MIRLKTIHKVALAFLLAALFTALTAAPPVRVLFEDLENRFLDYWFIVQGQLPTTQLPILVVLVEDDSTREYGFRSPTPRLLLADVIDRLNAVGARCAGFDYILDMPHYPDHDARLERSLAQSKIPVVLVDQILDRFARPSVQGFSKVTEDTRNMVRRYVLTKPGADPQSFAWVLYEACFGEAPAVPADIRPESVLLDFYGPPSLLSDAAPTFPVVSAKDLMSMPPEVVRDKIVLVGSGFEDLGDTFLTSFSTSQFGHRPSFGVELHATMLGMLIEGRFLHPVNSTVLLAALAVLFAAMGLSSFLLRTSFTLAIGLVEIVGWLALSAAAFLVAGVTIPAFVPVLFMVLIFVICQTVLYFTEARYSKFLHSTFSRYISPDVVKQMVDHQWGLDLGGESRLLSIFFSDLEGFTTFSERLSPQQLVSLLNEYLGSMTDILFEERGTIGAFIGDAIMAYFGAPLELPGHANHACRSALLMRKALARLNEDFQSRNIQSLEMRIGIHTGEVVVGNIGSEKRQDFTIIGDAVNLAARLEGANKVFSSRIMVSEATIELTDGSFFTRELGRIVVKGRTQPVAIYELFGEKADPDGITDRQQAVIAGYEAALEKFYAGEFAAAQGEFAGLVSTYQDPASVFMEGQCRSLAGEPAPPDWNGAIELTSK
ncbi:MAG: adenylate/guanylate cyclase domain-containing protein [SAR324 cluster bacterium]|nr:adenylate/guanylate cyclase domain-containing protein [SAR324 cluster bacterium]